MVAGKEGREGTVFWRKFRENFFMWNLVSCYWLSEKKIKLNLLGKEFGNKKLLRLSLFGTRRDLFV